MEQAQHFLTHFTGYTGYVFFFCLIFACGVGLPFNSDISLITASVLAASGHFNIYVLMILAFIALMCGDTCTFFAGRKWGLELVKRRPFIWIFPHKNIVRAQNFIQNRGSGVVFLFRFTPLIRTVLYFTSGTLQVSPAKFYTMDIMATLTYLPLIMGISYYASENIDQVILVMKQFQFIILGVLILMLGAVTFKINKNKKKTKIS